MAVTSKWRQHIKKWQSSGLTQVKYCEQQHINVRTFTARLSDYRKLSSADPGLGSVMVDSSIKAVSRYDYPND